MILLTTCLFLSLGSYIFLGLLLRGNIQTTPPGKSDWQPTVSVIVAAKNEEKYLNACLASLDRLDYPTEKLQIVVVDDASTDNTTAIITDFVATARNNIRPIRLEEGEKEKSGKAGALLAGIEKSHGEIIFITDADCVVPPSWVKTMLSGFREQIGVVGGFTLLHPTDRFWGKLQELDWLYLLSIASAASQLNKPITWVGNNLAVRRLAYDAVGGYRHVNESFVEDFALIDAIEHQTRWQSRFYASPHGVVRTHAAESLADLYAQRKRWSLGVSSARPFGLWVMFTGFLTHLSLFVLFLFSPVSALPAALIKISIDYLIFQKISRIFHEPLSVQYFFFFDVYFAGYVMLLPIFMLIDRRITWKGARLQRD